MTKVAVIQQPPVYLDLEKTMSRAIQLIEEAADNGAQMVVFPEAWFPGYPTFVWRLPPGAGMGKTDELFGRLQSNAIDLSRGGMRPLQEAARDHAVVVVAGYQELDGAVSGSTLYNSCIIIDADGAIANNHRKLMPTNPERMVWGVRRRVRPECRRHCCWSRRSSPMLGKLHALGAIRALCPEHRYLCRADLGQRRHLAGHDAAHRARRRVLGHWLRHGP